MKMALPSQHGKVCIYVMLPAVPPCSEILDIA